MSRFISSVQKLVEQADDFPQMSSGQQAAYRARITSYLKKVEDDELRGILLELQAEVGTAEKKSKGKLTAETLEEQAADYAHMEVKSRPSFKANVTRLLKEAKEAGDKPAQKRLEAIQKGVHAFEVKEAREALMQSVQSRRRLTNP